MLILKFETYKLTEFYDKFESDSVCNIFINKKNNVNGIHRTVTCKLYMNCESLTEQFQV